MFVTGQDSEEDRRKRRRVRKRATLFRGGEDARTSTGAACLASFYSAYHEKWRPFIKQCSRALSGGLKREDPTAAAAARRWPPPCTTLNTEHGDRTKCPSLKWPPETLLPVCLSLHICFFPPISSSSSSFFS